MFTEPSDHELNIKIFFLNLWTLIFIISLKMFGDLFRFIQGGKYAQAWKTYISIMIQEWKS